jgi:hypothetical protein
MVSIGCHGVQQGIGTGLHMAVQENLAALVKDTDLHRPGVQVDAAVIAMLFAVEAPEILCRRTRRTRATGVKLLQTFVTQLAEPHKKESDDGDTSGDPYGSGHDTPADPVLGL